MTLCDSLLQNGKSFEDMNWFETLVFYGFEETAGLDALRNDSDVNLVPLVVDKVIIPKITGDGIYNRSL